MCLAGGGIRKGFVALMAAVRLLPGVDPDVSRVVPRVGEFLAAILETEKRQTQRNNLQVVMSPRDRYTQPGAQSIAA